MSDLDAARRVAAVAHDHALAHDSEGEGLCLAATAAVAWALTQRGIGCRAVTGTFDGHPHWWLDVNGTVVDPTRHQFEDRHDLLYPDNFGYVVEATYPPGWTREHVVMEAERAFVYPAAGRMWAVALLGDLDGAAV